MTFVPAAAGWFARFKAPNDGRVSRYQVVLWTTMDGEGGTSEAEVEEAAVRRSVHGPVDGLVLVDDGTFASAAGMDDFDGFERDDSALVQVADIGSGWHAAGSADDPPAAERVPVVAVGLTAAGAVRFVAADGTVVQGVTRHPST